MGVNVLAVSVSETCRMIGIGRSSVFKFLKTGQLERCKLGRRTCVTISSIERLVQSSTATITKDDV